MDRPKMYPDELIGRGLRLAFKSGRPVSHVVRDLGLPPKTLPSRVRFLDALRDASATREHGSRSAAGASIGCRSHYNSSDYTDAQRLPVARIYRIRRRRVRYALAEGFVDSFKTELIADRVGRTQSQLELAAVEYVAGFNTDRMQLRA